jgi:hypothetical protein
VSGRVERRSLTSGDYPATGFESRTWRAIDPREVACDRDDVSGDRPRGLPDGVLGMVAALVACGAGATLAVEVGVEARVSIVIASAVAILAAIAIKIGTDLRTARIVKAIADGDVELDAVPDRIRARLASYQHRRILARALRKVATDAGKYPWQGRLAAPPIVPHFPPDTCHLLVHLADVLEAADDLELRGVAMVEDLVTNPASPLFGSAEEDVEIAVRRVLFMLDAD